MKTVTKISIVVSVLTVMIGYIGFFTNLAVLHKEKKLEKNLEG